MKPRIFTAAFKLRMCHLAASKQMTQARICQENNLAHSVLERWYRAYREHGENAFVPTPLRQEELLQQRVQDLERLCGRLALDNELLKRAVRRSRSASDTP